MDKFSRTAVVDDIDRAAWDAECKARAERVRAIADGKKEKGDPTDSPWYGRVKSPSAATMRDLAEAMLREARGGK